MIRKAGLTLLFAANLFASNAFSVTTHAFTQGPAAEYILLPNEPQLFVNVFMWKVNATCKVTSANEENPLEINVLHKSGSFNGIPLSSGDSITVIVHANQQITLSAAPAGKVELVNRGNVAMKVACSSS